MEDFFSWVAAGFGALFIVAVVVAWWEHLARNARPPTAPTVSKTRAVTVDVPLDTVAGVLLPTTDTDERRAALGGAIERMGRVGRAARADTPPSTEPWPETGPMVLHPMPDPAAAPMPAPKSKA